LVRIERLGLRYNAHVNRVFEPDESLAELPLPPAFGFGWPRNFRRFMFYCFAATSVLYLALCLYMLPHFRNSSLIRNLLLGPLFEFTLAALSGMAAWTIWKAHHSARGWAIATSLLYLSIFMRQFLIPMRPVRDHYLISLTVELVGLAAFAWPDRVTSLPNSSKTA
jgi:hypothetical protein